VSGKAAGAYGCAMIAHGRSRSTPSIRQPGSGEVPAGRHLSVRPL